MKTKFNYSILKESQTIIEYYSGKITIDEIRTNQQNRFQDNDYDETYNVLIDFRDSDIEFNICELETYISDYIDHMNRNSIGFNSKTSILTDKPEHVVLAHVAKIGFHNLVELGMFSTITASIFHINRYCDDMVKIEEELLNLKNR